ncbi:MAG: dihydroorotate dehydrogenase electron transfer subunit [Clostridiales bacterium]|nr:dihydroorotate dehydrogenase electron transfer subunit [Clostridiales bacterium]MCI7573629.1 dihydroorotate dehydrogenase electron transfer subunit [Clostridiales bacterium]
MKKQTQFTILENAPLTASVYRMVLRGDTSAITAPGQFVNIALDGKFLRRPISVCDYDASTLTLIYKVVGSGTAQLSAMGGGTLDILTGLGNGYDISAAGDAPVLIGGGVGVPPMYRLAKDLTATGKTVSVILGFNTGSEIFLREEFEALGCKVIVTTADGSVGLRGFVTDALKDMDYSYFYACGPEPMLKAVYKASKTPGQMSFEERMGCGFGACMGCSCNTLTGYKRICKDGPVMKKEEIQWED